MKEYDNRKDDFVFLFYALIAMATNKHLRRS